MTKFFLAIIFIFSSAALAMDSSLSKLVNSPSNKNALIINHQDKARIMYDHLKEMSAEQFAQGVIRLVELDSLYPGENFADLALRYCKLFINVQYKRDQKVAAALNAIITQTFPQK